MANRILLRRDTAAVWAQVDPVLANGELGLETDTQQIKVGDGVHPWSEREYVVGSAQRVLDEFSTPGTDTYTALSVNIVTALAEDETVVNAAAIATGFGWLKVSETPPSRTRAVTTTNASTAITGTAGSFTSDDVGAPISGTGIPAGSTITAVTSDTEATLSGAATATGTVTATIGIIKVGGLDVVWIDKSEQLTPIPVNPPPPTWNDANGQVTIPSGVIGVDYVWTSGGGGIPGAVLTPGAVLGTSGTYPRTVTITAQPKPGYTAFATFVFGHDFPDPAAITVLTSDTFTAPADLTLLGTSGDLALGGAEKKWSTGPNNNYTPIVPNSMHRDGTKLVSGTASSGANLWYPGTHNMQIDFDLLSIVTPSPTDTSVVFAIARQKTVGGGLYTGPTVQLGANRYRVQAPNLAGGGLDLDFGLNKPAPLGHYTVKLYQTTFTVTDPLNGTRTWSLPPETYGIGHGAAGTLMSISENYAAGKSWEIDNLVVRQVGF